MKTHPFEFKPEAPQRVVAARVELERFLDQWRSLRIGHLRLPAALIQVSDRRSKRIETLVQAAIDALLDLVAEVADIVGAPHAR